MSPSPQIHDLTSWLPQGAEPLIIAGPCSAETREQVLQTGRQLARLSQVKVYRAGIWKPRTRPDGFEGVGEEGLKWMRELKAETGLQLTTEVANPHHIELALKHKIDMFWIGARTVVNPFSVQELAEALKGVDVPVLVKNPLTPDLKLWMGALERIHKAGINKLAAIHRGFHYFKQSPYRNAPMWEIPIELRRLLPSLPVITDISHITGRRDLLQSVAQKALDLETNGLMIESHIDPEHALTDADQQISPSDLEKLLATLIVRERTGSIDFQHKLEELRTEIDKLDGELMQLLARRMEVVGEIGAYKKENNITILQLKRWKHMIEDRLAIGMSMGLDREFLLLLLELVHETSIQLQTRIFNQDRD
ncbi:MAG: bifunctional 3-deoxy-7-phosphoheptulonate synthase/chorismate mutase type II [Bacteroidales bacterium]|jgi:chorismate mutase|nr:bifunctional 3-deoxy-7-phosphoheptulonate synthase/chorismate mutase type II [Bacteroidales bacterium]MDN5349597.1 chorismate mutase [Bacteroidales bacterium]